MITRYHTRFDAWNAESSRFNDEYALDWFLRRMASITDSRILHGPVVVNRKQGIEGITAFIITESSHIVLHTFPGNKEATISIYSYNKLNGVEIRDFIMHYFDLDIGSIRAIDISSQQEDFVQCEEPGCTRKAVKVWGGRKVCFDHYDHYRDIEIKPEFLDDY